MLRTALLSLLLCCLAASLPAQAQKGDNFAAANAAFDEGVQLLLNGKPKRAIKPFREAIKLDTGYIAAHRFLGLSQELVGNFASAAEAYQHVLNRDSTFSRLLYYKLGKVYYKMSRPKLALYYLERFEELQARNIGDFGRNGEEEAVEERKVLNRLDGEIKAARITQDSSQFINVTKLFNMGFPVNTQQNDYFPFFANDPNRFLFTRQGQGHDEDLLIGRRKDADGEWFTTRFGSFNTLRPEGMCSIVRDGQRIYFTICKGEEVVVAKGFRRTGNCDLYAGWLVDGKIEDIIPLPDYINSPVSWETQAAISCDEQQLFFVSEREPSFGMTDIFVCARQPDGSWGEPKNLGDGVNTPEAEEAPFLSDDGETLYFSSTGHYSLGDEDIFASWWDNSQKRFTQALNLGPPVNGPHRELGFHLSADGKTGYVASDRPGGLGKLDIYGFKLSERLSSRPITYLSGFVTDSLTGEPIVDQVVSIGNGKVYRTNYEGRFFVCAPSSEPLSIKVDNTDYLPYARTFAVPPWANVAPYRIDLFLNKEMVIPPPAPPPLLEEEKEEEEAEYAPRIKKVPYTVLFNFEDASLTARAIEGLQLFVGEIKGLNIVNIRVTGFTDSSGDAEFNLRLSQDRAKAVGVHLQTAGVKASEFNIVGAGELPGASQRALNRKVEITVVYRELVRIN
jgi:outer membrane protein OmpA-like peptidoglycan-associated protein/tetratricopeptide (TPR) repeat protein